MPALNFEKQFAEMVRSGEKRQTIRAHRKRPIHKADTLHLYTGMRTKTCEKLGEGTCVSVVRIQIGRGWVGIGSLQIVRPWDRAQIARDDGFPNPEMMERFFEQQYGLPFDGVLIEWELQ